MNVNRKTNNLGLLISINIYITNKYPKIYPEAATACPNS